VKTRPLADRLASTLEVIDRESTRRVSIAELARLAGCSRFHFMRAFQRAYGVSPGQRQRERRIVRARELLSTTPAPVTEISRRVGYRSLGTFSRVFHAATGESPTAFRRRTRKRVYIPSCFTRMFRVDS
jgi:transcriptional regulator GlxA family with amidase domain